MVSFIELKSELEAKLERKLCNNEVKFLQWMYERYTQEQLKNSPTDLCSGLQTLLAR
ncbi:hypothetical protein ACFO3D_07880 [Virgibacillus kekensis]|uniref:Uncharacterized protein n=1 Tax=Virgibacillus kekensis TaxID=202261 RepID=A0ABV9DJ74_9BACI